MKNLKSKKLYFQVYEELKLYITKNNMKPGDRLPTEMEMCEILGVSRNVLREAIKTFEIIGVLTSKAGVGIVLNSFNSNFLSSCMFLNLIEDNVNLVEQSQEVRKGLELFFAKDSLNSMDSNQINKLEALLEKMRTHHKDIDFYEIDSNFHHTLFEKVNNLVLLAFLDSSWECDKAYRATLVFDEPELRYTKHKAIVDAIKAKDYSAYIEALTYHFSYEFKHDPNEKVKELGA
jgi:DNA-binding FadR family transcriptional regulator